MIVKENTYVARRLQTSALAGVEGESHPSTHPRAGALSLIGRPSRQFSCESELRFRETLFRARVIEKERTLGGC